METHVLATFTRREEAVSTARAAREAFPSMEVRLGDTDDNLDAMTLGQRDEMDEAFPAFSSGIMSGPMARGALFWGFIGLVVGAIVGMLAMLVIDRGDNPFWWILVFFAMAGGFAVSTYAFVLGGARQAVKEGATTPQDPTAVIRVDRLAERTDDVERFFVAAGARSVQVIDAPVNRLPTSEVEAPHRLRTDPAVTSGEGSDQDAGFHSDV